jgi:pimeloyl-ACP methyl ester carboxylesterase
VRKGFLFILVALAGGVLGCAGPRGGGHLPSTKVLAPQQGTIFAVDGAGNFQECSKALRRAVEADHLDVDVETHEWSHGYWRVIADHTDTAHSKHEAHELAEKVLKFRQENPDCPVYLVGHCTGSFILLQTTELLPPDSIDRIVLLSPSVSADYDLRPALRCSKLGVDVFWSYRDWFYLGTCVRIIGNADRKWGPAAGRVGFKPIIECEADVDLYTKLRQHPWQPAVAWTGNEGGHFDAYHTPFLRNFVLNLCRRRQQQLLDGAEPKKGIPGIFSRGAGEKAPADKDPTGE